MSPGKQFEQDLRRSMPAGVYCLKLPDPANGFRSSQEAKATRFAPRPPFDFVLCAGGRMVALEAKSVQTRSLSYGESSSARIKVRQVESLRKVESAGGTAGLIINFRSDGETYFVPASAFVKEMEAGKRKSFSIEQARSAGVLVSQRLAKTRYIYDLSPVLGCGE